MAPKSSLNLSDDQRFALMKIWLRTLQLAVMGYIVPATKCDFQLLKQNRALRRNVADCCNKPYHNDQFLLRWLRARNFDPAAAEKMLRLSLKWREEWNVDSLSEWTPPEVFSKFYPSGLSGFDKDGAPVIVLPFAGLDMWGMLHSVTKTDFIKMTIRTLESHLELARQQAETHGPLAGQLVAVIDMTDFNLKQYAWRPAGEVVISMIQMYEANYPEILKACYIINVPKVFALAFSVVKNFLNEYTLSKIQIYKSDPAKWQPVLLRQIPANNLPAHFGGDMVDPDGNPRCPSKVCQGGKVPKCYYTKNQEKQTTDGRNKYTQVTIKKGDKLCIDFLAAQDGSFLKWDFYSDGHDIKFGVLSKDEEGKENVVIPIRRVPCHQSEEVGFILCSAPATYTVVFDNTYSYLRNKKLHYSLTMSAPIDASCENDEYPNPEE